MKRTRVVHSKREGIRDCAIKEAEQGSAAQSQIRDEGTRRGGRGSAETRSDPVALSLVACSCPIIGVH